MGGSTSPNRRTMVVLALAMVVLVGAILAALTRDDDHKRTTTLPTPTTPPTVSTPRSTTTVRASTTSTLKDLPGAGSTTTPLPPTTVEPAVPTPEQAATGLFAAYRAGDRDQAATFATEDVIAVLFAQPYAPPDGSFQGCRPDGELYHCSYVQGSTSYDMTAQRHPDTGSFLIVVITVFRPADTTSTAPPTSTTGAPLSSP